jgi:hypothetical protein
VTCADVREPEPRRSPLQRRHARQSELPECFALATLAAAIREPRAKTQERPRARAARQVAQLLKRGEL